MGQAVHNAEVLVEQYEPLIRKMGAQCYRKLPPRSMYDREDLYQEGRIRALKVADQFDPTRGAKFMTFLTVALRNRYANILAEEWRRCPPWGVSGAGKFSLGGGPYGVGAGGFPPSDHPRYPDPTLDHPAAPSVVEQPGQRAVVEAMGLEVREANLLDRYGRLRRRRWLVVERGGGRSVVVRREGELRALLGQLPARPGGIRTPMARIPAPSSGGSPLNHVSHTAMA